MADAELAPAPPAVQETLVEAKLFGKWDFSDVEVRQPGAESPSVHGSSRFCLNEQHARPYLTGCTPEQYETPLLPGVPLSRLGWHSAARQLVNLMNSQLLLQDHRCWACEAYGHILGSSCGCPYRLAIIEKLRAVCDIFSSHLCRSVTWPWKITLPSSPSLHGMYHTQLADTRRSGSGRRNALLLRGEIL